MQEKKMGAQGQYPLKVFLRDVVVLWKWKRPEPGVTSGLFQKKCSELTFNQIELEQFKKSVSLELSEAIRYLFFSGVWLSFMAYGLFKENPRYIFYGFVLSMLCFLVSKAYFRNTCDILKK